MWHLACKVCFSLREVNLVLPKAVGANAGVTSAASTLCIPVPSSPAGHRHSRPGKGASSLTSQLGRDASGSGKHETSPLPPLLGLRGRYLITHRAEHDKFLLQFFPEKQRVRNTARSF